MEIKTITAVNSYPILKGIKVSDLSDDAAFAVWKAIKALRPIHEEYNKEREEVLGTMRDDTFKQLQERLKKAQEREEKVNKSEYTMTPEDIKDVAEINNYYAVFNGKVEKYFAEQNEKMVVVDVNPVPEDELLKAVKASGKGFSEMETLEWLTE